MGSFASGANLALVFSSRNYALNPIALHRIVSLGSNDAGSPCPETR